jgi:hypothetical protein
MLATGTGNRVHPQSQRGADLYETPECAVRALLDVEDIPRAVWEPAAGRGAIVRPLIATGRTVIATDLNDYNCEYHEGGIDFLMEQSAPADCIVTNPPFKLGTEFVAHAIDLVPRVHMLLRLAFLEGIRWHDAAPGAHGSKALGLNRTLARVHIFAPRLPMMHRDGWYGPINSNSAMAFAWFTWDRDHKGPPSLGWIYTRDYE